MYDTISVTVYERIGGKYVPHVMNGHVYGKTEVVKDGNGLQYANSCIVRFPGRTVPYIPQINDYIVVAETVECYETAAKLMGAHKGESYKIKSVSDNRSGTLPHIKVVSA